MTAPDDTVAGDRPPPTSHEAVPLDVVVPEALAGERVDRALAFLGDVSRRRATELIEQGAVRVGGQVVGNRRRPLVAGERLEALLLPEPGDRLWPDTGITFGVVYEDEDLIVVDKPAGLVVHHGAGHHGGTLIDGLVARYPELARLPEEGAGEPGRPGLVHRLDKGTSGLLVVARTPAAYHALSRQFRDHSAERVYQALVAGRLEHVSGIVDAPIGRSVRTPGRMTVSAAGRPARTRYEVVERLSVPVETTLVQVTLETGRTHQVRVHLAAIGHPVLGDDRDRSRQDAARQLVELLGPGRLFLHAGQLSLEHPAGGLRTWQSPLPADLERVLAAARR